MGRVVYDLPELNPPNPQVKKKRSLNVGHRGWGRDVIRRMYVTV